MLDLLLCILFLSRQLTFLEFKVALLFIHEDGEVLDLRLLSCDGLDELPLILKVRIANQLRMVHLDHLKLLCCGKLLLNKRVTLPRMGLLYFVYLSHKSLFIFCSLLCADFFSLVRKLKHCLRMIRLQLLFIVSEIFHLLFVLLNLELKLALLRLLLQLADLLLRQAFFLSHLRVEQLLLEHLHLVLVVGLALLHLSDHLLLLLQLLLQGTLGHGPVGQNLVYSFACLDLDGLFGHVSVLSLNVLHRLVKDLLHLPVLLPFGFQALT